MRRTPEIPTQEDSLLDSLFMATDGKPISHETCPAGKNHRYERARELTLSVPGVKIVWITTGQDPFESRTLDVPIARITITDEVVDDRRGRLNRPPKHNQTTRLIRVGLYQGHGGNPDDGVWHYHETLGIPPRQDFDLISVGGNWGRVRLEPDTPVTGYELPDGGFDEFSTVVESWIALREANTISNSPE